MRLRRVLLASLATLIILTGIVVGVGRALVPWADDLRPWLETRMSARLGQPVEIGRVEARWPRLTPQIILHQVRAGGEGAALVELDRTQLELHLPSLLRGSRNAARLVVAGLDLALSEDESGQWGLSFSRGGQLSAQGGGADARLALDLLVRDARVQIRPQRMAALEVQIDEGWFLRHDDQTAFMARARLTASPDSGLRIAVMAESGRRGVENVRGQLDLQQLRLDALGLERWIQPGMALPPDYLDFNLDFDWQRDGGGSADLEFSLGDHAGFDLDGHLRLERSDRRVDLELVELNQQQRPLIRNLVLAGQGALSALAVEQLDLADLHALASRWMQGWAQWPQALDGEIRDLELLYQHPGALHALRGQVRGFTIDLPGDRLALRNLDAELGLSGDRAVLELSGSPVLDWPMKMRQAIAVDEIGGRAIVSPAAVELDRVWARRPEADAWASGWVWIGGGRPFMDFSVVAERVTSVDPRPWLPAGQIPPKALEWLDLALLAVGQAEGELNYHVRLGYPFASWDDGNFQAQMDFRQADVNFWHDWPLAHGLEGWAEFSGRSLKAGVRQGAIGTVALSGGQVEIDNLSEPEVAVHLATGHTRAETLRQLLADLPLNAVPALARMLQAQGALDLALDLHFPVRRMQHWSMDGRLELEGAGLALPAAGLHFQRLDGRLNFTQDELFPAELSLRDGAERLQLQAGFEKPAWLELSGRLSPAALLAQGPRLDVLAGRLHGTAWWHARVEDRGEGWGLRLHSDLIGLETDLAPLSGRAWQPRPLALDLQVTPERMQLAAELGQQARLASVEEGGRLQLAVGLGEALPALPMGSGMEISGQVRQLDLQPWLELLSAWVPAAPDPEASGRLHLLADTLLYRGWRLDQFELDAVRRPEQWRVALTGPAVSGQLILPLPLDSGRVISVDLARLALSGARADELLNHQAEETRLPPSDTTPSGFPPLHLLVESLQLDELDLGRLRLESHARSDGIEIEHIEAEGPLLQLEGRGRWVDHGGHPQTEFEGRLRSADLPGLLAALGMSARLDSEHSQIQLRGSWVGAPSDFALARLNGRLELSMFNGRIIDAQPGAGRLVGLVSLGAVPRRLMLDFRDVFGQGLSFDEVAGGFTIRDGVAHTEGLMLRSPAATITVRGDTDLGAQRYDQVIHVEPAVGSTLPVLGGLAGGPVGVGVGLLLQGLLHGPLQGIAEARYQVTGSWQEPEVKLLDARPARPDYQQGHRQDSQQDSQQDDGSGNQPARQNGSEVSEPVPDPPVSPDTD